MLVPRRRDAHELEDLAIAEMALLTREILVAGRAVRAIGALLERPVEKLNIGALGNIVSQLHIHVVGRRADDPAWPGPVWGAGQALAYMDGELHRAIAAAKAVFNTDAG